MSDLPRQILERIDRVLEYHRATARTEASLRASGATDAANQPSPYRVFPEALKIPLPTKLLDAAAPAIGVLTDGVATLPESQIGPPANLRTIATWLHLAAGRTVEQPVGAKKIWLRAYPSAAALYPSEIYLAAFNMEDLEPGFYHFSVSEFALRKLRDGPETLATIKRGRPDLAFLQSVPAALLISTIFWRSAWKFRQGGYRIALLDAGHVIENLVAVGNGLGITTMPRLRVQESNMRDLLGLAVDAAFGAAESVQAMVVWADHAGTEAAPTRAPNRAAMPPAGPLPLIEREPLSPEFLPYGTITATHADCVAPGMAVRTIRPPTTGTCAMPPTESGVELPPPAQVVLGASLRQIVLSRRSATRFDRARPIRRDHFLTINRTAFLTGSFDPILPDGAHVGLVRPFWIVHDVSGLDRGIWYYHPPADKWWLMRNGDFRFESGYLCAEQSFVGDASAVCWICADLKTLCSETGPDAYRLAHLEAGIVAERIHLTANALGISCCGLGSFYDAEVRNFIGAEEGTWEPLYAMAIGMGK